MAVHPTALTRGAHLHCAFCKHCASARIRECGELFRGENRREFGRASPPRCAVLPTPLHFRLVRAAGFRPALPAVMLRAETRTGAVAVVDHIVMSCWRNLDGADLLHQREVVAAWPVCGVGRRRDAAEPDAASLSRRQSRSPEWSERCRHSASSLWRELLRPRCCRRR